MTQVHAGADAGGSKTRAAVARDGVELGRASGPGGAVRPGRAMSSAAVIAGVVRRALNQSGHLRAQVLVVGAAGAGSDEERRALRDALRVEDLADRLHVTTDLELALEAAFGQGSGIVLLAGTGSIAAARLPDGRVIRQGGYGWQMGDEGSGYALGRAALLAVGRAQDRRGPATALTSLLLEATRTREFPELVRWASGADPWEVATLGALVAEAAEAGDPVAAEIARDGAAGLAAQVEALVGEFHSPQAIEVALGGGLLEHPGYRAAVQSALASHDRVRVESEAIDPVRGALALAGRL